MKMGNKYKLEITADSLAELQSTMELMNREKNLRGAHEQVWRELFLPNIRAGYDNPDLDNGDAHAAIGLLAQRYTRILSRWGLELPHKTSEITGGQ